MPRPRNSTPSYLEHTQSGKARAVWTDQSGRRRDQILPGAYGSPESREAYGRLCLELAVAPASALTGQHGLTVAEVLLAYLNFAKRYYADPDGNPTKELACVKSAIRPVRELYAGLPAVQFGPVALRAVRQRMIESGWCRTLVNRRVDLVKRVFRWGASEELVPVATYEALRTLAGLRRGKTEAPERVPVKPVSDDVVNATLPHLPIHVRAMIELMLYTGMRPAEVCSMTLGQIDRTSPTWVYAPVSHKTANAGKARLIPLGPNARRVLVDFLKGRSLDPDAPLFSPRRAREERFAEMRANRQTKVQPSQVDRRKVKPKRLPAERYCPVTIAHAVKEAAKRAGVPHWFPYQLRHSFGTRVRKQHGLEASQVLLGHARADVTQIYAEKNIELALAVAAKIG